jgi:hypothetical protein
MFTPEEPSPPLTPERKAARQLLNDGERKILEAMESDLGRPLTEEEERLAWSQAHSSSSHAPKILPDESHRLTISTRCPAGALMAARSDG